MGLFLPSWLSLSTSQNAADLGLGPQRPLVRLKRLALFRKRWLLFNVYIIFLCVVLVIPGLYYMDPRGIYDIQRPFMSLPQNNPASYNRTRLLPGPLHYIAFEPPASSPEPFPDRSLRALPRLPRNCLESHISLGYPCFVPGPTDFDIVWTWVNGSDPRLQGTMEQTVLPKTAPAMKSRPDAVSNPTSKLYRDHDELRHSFRSVLRHFRNYTRRFHTLISDFPFTEDDCANYVSPSTSSPVSAIHKRIDDGSVGSMEADLGPPDSVPEVTHCNLRLGQIPSWLSVAEEGQWRDGNIDLMVSFQAQVFQNYTGTSFNSYSIESQLHYLPGVEQNFIYMNDDFFFMGDLLPSDFYTSGQSFPVLPRAVNGIHAFGDRVAFGMVLRLDPTLLVNAVPASSEENPAGEWGPLLYSNWLISERFGLRPRPYPIHAAKSLSIPLLQEAANIWEDEFRSTAEHKFRGMRNPETGAGDMHMSFLLTHLVVERWREALLWSWVIGRIGGDEDQWGMGQKMLAWEELGGDPEDIEFEVNVRLTRRKTVDEDRVARTLESSGQMFSKKTTYSFSSADGYPYSYTNRRDKMTWPSFSGSNLGQNLCSINFHACIGTASSASEAFKAIAFEKPLLCGDCIIAALRSSSGVLGLSAFLPQRQRKFKPSVPSPVWDQLQFDIWGGADDGDDMKDDDSDQSEPPVAHLPLVKTWAEGNFSLQAVLDPYGVVNVRAWTLRLLERYRFVLGDTNTVFVMIEGPYHASNSLKAITEDVALLCMNDDVKDRYVLTDKILRDWQRRRWSRPAEWER